MESQWICSFVENGLGMTCCFGVFFGCTMEFLMGEYNIHIYIYIYIYIGSRHTDTLVCLKMGYINHFVAENDEANGIGFWGLHHFQVGFPPKWLLVKPQKLVGGDWNMNGLRLSIYWEFHHPN